MLSCTRWPSHVTAFFVRDCSVMNAQDNGRTIRLLERVTESFVFFFVDVLTDKPDRTFLP